MEVELPKKNVLDEDGQADELTDAEQHDSVFLLEGPIWASLSMEEKEKIQQGARMRHSMISFRKIRSNQIAFKFGVCTRKMLLMKLSIVLARFFPSTLPRY